MNFLAHIYLSGNDKQLQVGNFIGDYVKGAAYNTYSPRIAAGILLHRAIDSYTDNHAKQQEAKRLLQPVTGRYSGIFVDMFYDHFLAANWELFSPIPLKRFARAFYRNMLWRYRILPAQVQRFLPHLIASNRLCKYAAISGLQDSLKIMEEYTSLPATTTEAIALLTTRYDELRGNFLTFFPDLQAFTAAKIIELDAL